MINQALLSVALFFSLFFSIQKPNLLDWVCSYFLFYNWTETAFLSVPTFHDTSYTSYRYHKDRGHCDQQSSQIRLLPYLLPNQNYHVWR